MTFGARINIHSICIIEIQYIATHVGNCIIFWPVVHHCCSALAGERATVIATMTLAFAIASCFDNAEFGPGALKAV